MLKDRVILFHPVRGGVVFDVFRRKGSDWRPPLALYQASECAFATRFLEKNPDYEYLGSEDFAHFGSLALEIMKEVIQLIREGDIDVVFDNF